MKKNKLFYPMLHVDLYRCDFVHNIDFFVML